MVENRNDITVLPGDSAKALAVAGLEVVGRDRYGVFPVMGKFMNVSGLSKEKVGCVFIVRELVPSAS
ncbi:hypothetical protein ANCCAN_19520 [Ancylostoma caninum]|uniref:DNA topoisomerase (ATP-hydrolyzing) n=1 Tax=Ancylostoma caninum TaxID=29170 RepID=A0A368FQY5_ANCCA|nr:hypothetical protein ANCCAN_19520 [Ancylostoma caninum]